MSNRNPGACVGSSDTKTYQHSARRWSLGLAAAVGAAALAFAPPARATLTIKPTYDSSVTGLSTFSQVQSAFSYAAQQYENAFSDPITINITVSAAPGGLGSSNTSLQSTSYSALRTAITADAKSANDATAVATLPVTDPTGTNAYWLTLAQAKALGLRSANNTAQDGQFTFASDVTYTFDPNNRQVPGAYDFIGVAEHEISEIMGRIGLLGDTINNAPGYGLYDLFGFTGAGARSMNQTNTNVYFSIDNGVTNLKVFNNPGNGGDLRDWASGQGNDAYNAFTSTNARNDITAVDLTAMDVIGYDPAPEPASLALLSLGGLGLLARRRRRH